jgi:hypothetical protein
VDNVDISKVRVYDPFPFGPVITHTAETAFQLILQDVGASLKRDSLDLRIVHEAITGTATYGGTLGSGSGLIDSQDEVGGWPVLNTYDVPEDNDKDGMADDWELANGLNPNDPEDRNGDFNGNGYTNLEKYLNELCIRDDYIVAPAELTAFAFSDAEINLHWKENAANESGFSIERSVNDTTGFEVIATTGPDVTSYKDNNLERSTLYFYRIRAFNDHVNSLYTNISATSTLDSAGVPLPVTGPSPVDSAQDVSLMAQLKWNAAPGATSYNVYIGNTEDPDFVGNQTVTVFNTPGWQDNLTYYWRIDAVNDVGTTMGPLWQFTTLKLPPELMAHWRMDRGYGTLAVDASGNSNHATFQNMTEDSWVKGIMGTTGLYFSGEQQHLKAGHRAAINFSKKSFTMMLWIRSSSSGKIQPLVTKSLLSTDSLTNGYRLYLDGTGKIIFHVQDSVNYSQLTNNDVSVNSGEWEFISVVRDMSKRQLRLYHNGTLISSAIDSTNNLNNDASLYIAADALQNDFYTGVIDDVRLYQNVVGDQQIANLYQSVVSEISDGEQVIIPKDLSIVNYPNPFNNQTTIRYTLPEVSDIEIVLYNILGEIVVRHTESEKQVGSHSWHFDAGKLSSGLYLCRLNAGRKSVLTKMILIK